MLRTTGYEIREGDHLCTDETPLHIAVDLPCCLRG
jgi:hypothetical protein